MRSPIKINTPFNMYHNFVSLRTYVILNHTNIRAHIYTHIAMFEWIPVRICEIASYMTLSAYTENSRDMCVSHMYSIHSYFMRTRLLAFAPHSIPTNWFSRLFIARVYKNRVYISQYQLKPLHLYLNRGMSKKTTKTNIPYIRLVFVMCAAIHLHI